MTPQSIAIVCHEANRALCLTQGDTSQKPWDEAPVWQKESAVAGVQFHLANPNAGTDDSHDSWMKQKIDTGWVFGPVKDEDLKQHPCIVPYDQLPAAQQAKDYLFRGIVHSLAIFVVDAVSTTAG